MTDSGRFEDTAQSPFVATSDSLTDIARAQGSRHQDEEMAKRMHEMWKAKWVDSDNGMRILIQQNDADDSNGISDKSLTWWSTLSSSSSTSSSSNLLSSSEKRKSPSGARSGRRRGSNSSKGNSKKKSQSRIIRIHSGDQYDAPPSFAQQLQAALTLSTDEPDEVFPKHSLASLLPPISNDDRSPIYARPDASDDTLALLLPLLVLLSTLLLLLLIFIVLVIFVRRRARIALTEGDGPLDVGREEELEGLGGLDGIEERWLETVDDSIRRGYARAKDWTLSFAPGSQSTDITLSQFLTIQEKGVSAWSFDPDYESNPSVFVEARTEITFIADGEGMAPQEGGGCCVQSNLPLPKLNEVYYWEAKMFTKPDTTNVAIGLATKPFPSFRLPGWSKFSVGFFSADGFKAHNYPFTAQSYGPAYMQGDVIGVGYRPRSGTVFFTRNGKKLDDAFVGLNKYNLFPTIGADGAAEVHINLGQAGFVFIEANVKKWGLAPMVGTLAPPPAYGMERGSILIETGQGTSNDQEIERISRRSNGRANRRESTPPPPPSPSDRSTARPPSSSPSSATISTRRRIKRSARISPGSTNALLPTDNVASRGSPNLDHSSSSSTSSSRRMQRESPMLSTRSDSVSSIDAPHNPPTPHHLDISLHSLDVGLIDGNHSPSTSPTVSSSRRGGGRGGVASYFPPILSLRDDRGRSPSPPPYLDQRHSWAVQSGSLGGTEASGNQARRASGRSHSIANALFGALADRGLLTPLSAQGSSPSHEAPRGATHISRMDSSSALDYERLQAANTQANRNISTSSTGSWLGSWFR